MELIIEVWAAGFAAVLGFIGAAHARRKEKHATFERVGLPVIIGASAAWPIFLPWVAIKLIRDRERD